MNGLRKGFQPQGTLEEILIDKLAMILWRHRRLILAERGQFLKKEQIHKLKLKKQQQREAEKIEASLGPVPIHGLIESISNPVILDYCLDHLTALRDRIQEDGDESASSEAHKSLIKIYGMDLYYRQGTLLNMYVRWSSRVIRASWKAERSDEPLTDEDLPDGEMAEVEDIQEDQEVDRSDKPLPGEDIIDTMVLKALDAEIHRLEEFKKSQIPDQRERSKQEVLRLSMNEGAGLERLVRYEASLERAFDRALAQLERVQRIRRGQLVAPRLEIDLNT